MMIANLARLTGLEPVTPAFGGQYSIQLSYRRVEWDPVARCPHPVQPGTGTIARDVNEEWYPDRNRASRPAIGRYR